MFSRKKRLDPKIRYQHQDFTRKLQQARQYKRSSTALPETSSRSFLYYLGLRTLTAQIIAGLVALVIIYLVFVPNFLFVHAIKVDGASNDDASSVKATVQSYLDNTSFLTAQRNLVLLRKNALTQALLADPKVYRVVSVKKDLWQRSLTVKIEPKTPKYVVNRNGAIYSVYNDGSVQQQLETDAGEWLDLNPGAIKIQDPNTAPNTLSEGAKYLSPDLLNVIMQLNDRLKPEANSEVHFFAIPSKVDSAPAPETEVQVEGETEAVTTLPETKDSKQQSEEGLPVNPLNLWVWVKKQNSPNDIKLIFDTKQDMSKALEKLRLLLTQTAPDRYAKLVYIDLRFENRAFICLAGTPCAQTDN